MAVPGDTPTSPETTDGPVFVTVVPASTANEPAVPSPTVGGAAEAVDVPARLPMSIRSAVTPTTSKADSELRILVRTGELACQLYKTA